MDGLFEDRRMEAASGDWVELVRALHAEVAQLRSAVEGLRRESLELRPAVGRTACRAASFV